MGDEKTSGRRSLPVRVYDESVVGEETKFDAVGRLLLVHRRGRGDDVNIRPGEFFSCCQILIPDKALLLPPGAVGGRSESSVSL